MKNRNGDSNYQEALRKLVDEKVISEKTAEVHLSEINHNAVGKIVSGDKLRENHLNIGFFSKKIILSLLIFLLLLVISNLVI